MNLKAATQVLGQAGLDLVFPPICLSCRQEYSSDNATGRLCPDCHTALQPLATPMCSACGVFAPELRRVGLKCVHCRDQILRFDRVIALGEYEDLLKNVVIAMKTDRHAMLTREMGNALAEHVAASHMDSLPDLVAAVPIHWFRKMTRGTHVSADLAKLVGRRLNVRSAVDLLACRRRMRKQAILLPNQRKRNVHNAFAVKWPSDVKGRHILVVDDVMTTGATLNEVARVLKQNQATNVTVAVIARGIGEANRR